MERKENGQFTSDGLKGNSFAKGNLLNKTSFDGTHKGKTHPSWKGGVQHNRKDVTCLSVGANKRVRRPRAVFEQYFGKIPKGYVIFHKDGDKDNDNIDNLEALTRAESLTRTLH